MKRILSLALSLLLIAALLCGCGSAASAPTPTAAPTAEPTAAPTPEPTVAPDPSPEPTAVPAGRIELPDGVYSAEFVTDSSMFHANEACDGKGVLTVKDGSGVFHVSLASTSILNLFVGTAEDAQKDGAVLLEHTEDEVTYSDGMTETVYGFDIPVNALDEDFALALIGKKGKWYDHTVSVRNAEPIAEGEMNDKAAEKEPVILSDGEYICDVTLSGGTGKAKVESPALVTVSGSTVLAHIVWSSPNYDYMLVNGEKLFPLPDRDTSEFDIPLLCFDEAFTVIADTVAMSTPHEIEYSLLFDSASLAACD